MKIAAADKFSNMRTCGAWGIFPANSCKDFNQRTLPTDDNAACSKSFTSQKLLHHKSFYFKWKFIIRLLQQICGAVFTKSHPDMF